MGFIPKSYDTPDAGPLIINARSETIVTKATFAQSIRTRRCIIPMSGYYEWQVDGGLGCHILPTIPTKGFDGGGWYLANVGRWNSETGYLCVITVPSAESMRHLHPRMPLVLSKSDWAKVAG